MKPLVRALGIGTVLLATVSPLAAQQPQTSDVLATRINELIRPAAEAELFSGVVLVARGRALLYQEAFGYANWELRVPNTPATRFGVGSLTKAMTSTILARVIEIIEGKPFEQVLEARIFQPAGMTATLSETGRQLMKERASPYHLGTDDQGIAVVNAPYKDLRFLTGAGSMYTTAEDLFRFLQAMHAGIFGDELWDQTVDADATTWRGFTGRTSGYEAYMDVLPSKDLSFVMVTNLRS